MLTSMTLANAAGTDIVIHEVSGTAKRSLISAKGLVGVGPLRASKRVRPSAHGAINETRFEDGRTVALEGEIVGATFAEAEEQFSAVSQVMLETLDSGPALMKWETSGGRKLQMRVKLDSDIEPVLSGVAPRYVYQASFFAEDPRSYAQSSSTVVGAGITGSAQEATFLKTSATTRPLQVCIDPGNTHIYWVDRVTKAIGRAAIGGGTIEPEWIKLGFVPTAVAVDAAHVYWGWKFVGGETKNILGRAAIGGGTIEENWFAVTANIGLNPIKAIVVNATNIFYAWSSAAGIPYIGRAPIAGGSFEESWLTLTNAGSSFEVNSLALDATYIYFGTSPGAIGRFPLAGGELNLEWITGMRTPHGLAVNATNIFWVDESRNLGRAKINGSEAFYAFIPGLESEPSGLALNTEHLYWGESNGYIARSKELANGGPVGSSCKVEQAGNRPSPLVFKINGPCVNPAIIAKTSGARLTLRGSIGAGNYVEVDAAARTVKLNGTTNLLSFLDAQNTNWSAFEAPNSPKAEIYELAATSATAAKLEAIVRASYA